MIDNSKEYILCAAWKRKSPKKVTSLPYKEHNELLNIEIGYRHHDIATRFYDELDLSGENCMGFFTSKNKFVDRIEGMKIAYEAGQVSEKRAFWTKEDIEDAWLPLTDTNPGDYKPLASEDLYCCSLDGDSLNE